MRWPFTYYTDALPEGRAAVTKGPVICIRAEYRDDEGLYRHELKHVAQFFGAWAVLTVLNAPLAWLVAIWWLPVAGADAIAPWSVAATVAAWCAAAHPVLYYFSRPYRQWAEATAYREQTLYPDGQGGQLSIERAAWRLALPMYDLGISVAQARDVLLND